MKRFFLIVLAVLTGVAICSCATVSSVVPLPNDILIISPDPNLPPEIKAFSGKWGGRWWSSGSSGGLDAALIVEEITGERATVVYGWGNSPEWNVKEGWERLIMLISRNEKGKIILSLPRMKFEIHVEKDKLEGIYSVRYTSYINYITMKRIQFQ